MYRKSAPPIEISADKPYNVCLTCPHLGVICDGPNFLAMTFERWVEWCNIRAAHLNMTHSDIAEKANISKGTVDGVLSGRSADVRRDTMAAITHALTGECWGQYPCALSSEETATDLKAENEHLKELLKEERTRTAYLKDQVKFKEDQMLAKDKVIAERGSFAIKQAIDIRILSILLGVAVSVIIMGLIVDLFNPNVGYFWLK